MEEGQAAPSELSEFTMLNPVSKKAMYAGNVLTLAAFAAFAVASVALTRGTGWYDAVLYAMSAVVALLAIYMLASPPIFYKHYRYRMDEDCVEVRRGVIIRSHTLVPVERIHQVNVSKGPILRRFGLADVTITTAGGTVALQYLDEEIAERIASNLNERIVAMLRARG